jgi:uncharacterized membrane protein
MSWNPNQGQNPNQQPPYTNYPPPQGNPYGGQQYGYGQQQQQQYGNPYQQPYGAPPYAGAPANASPLGPSSIGMDPKVSAGLGYLVWVLSIVFFFIEKQNRFVRFHALQAILLGVGATVVFIAFYIVLFILLVIAGAANSNVLAGIIGLLSILGYLVIVVGGFIGWLLGMINAFQGKYFKIPVIGNWADKWAGAGI